MKIAMIGTNGFVGTRPLDLLRQGPSKYDCRNIDLLPSHFFNDITTIGDVREQEQMDHELKGADIVILLAAQHRDDGRQFPFTTIPTSVACRFNY